MGPVDKSTWASPRKTITATLPGAKSSLIFFKNRFKGLIIISSNVGIGTTSPSVLLNLKGAGATGQVIIESDDYDGAGGNGEAAWISVDNDYISIYALKNGNTAWGDTILQSGGGNVGIGTTAPNYKLDVNGGGVNITTPATGGSGSGLRVTNDNTGGWSIYVAGASPYGMYLAGSTNTCGDVGTANGTCDITADYAELMYFSEEVENGDVVIIDTENEAKFKLSTQPYDKLVVGVVSKDPAMVIGPEGINIKGWETNTENAQPLAVAGKKRIKVSEENGPIIPGDLLVSSSDALSP